MRRNIERPALRARERANERMNRTLQNFLFRLGELEPERLTRVCDRVMDVEPLKLCFHLWGKCVICRSHVGELCLRPNWRDNLCGEQRVAARWILERRVGMPQTIPQSVHPATV